MPTDHRAKLATIKSFPQLVAYLRDEMGWPIENGSAFEDLTFEYTPDELGIDAKNAAKIQEIKRLRPLSPNQPWGIFFVKFEPKKLPVVALRRILSQVALKRRASANSAERAAWAADDLLFVSNYGEGDERQISFAHFSRAQDGHELPTLKVLGWDNRDTALHLDAVARELSEHLAWPEDDRDAEAWRKRWRAAFTLGHREVVTTSKELSIRLAELARNIRGRIRTALAIETDKGPLSRLMKAFQEALVHDLDADGFADMYAQTIAYGLLSARIADPQKKTTDDFAAQMRTNPFLRELMETFLKVGGRRGKAGGPGIDFDELGVSEVVELLDNAKMDAVVRDFGDRNPQEDPVIHFYELFLKEYDAKKRMQRGVFYTPRPVVSYIVRSVDELLRTEFALADGLADTTTWGEMIKRHKDLKVPEGVSPDQDFVQILDPATGTGTFLVEVIDLIHKTLVGKWKAQGHDETKIDALWNAYVPKHLLTRLHGYELLMAPYAIAHLKTGLKLYETGYHFDSDERVRVFLTNALEPAHDFAGTLAVPAFAHVAQSVSAVKRSVRFTIVIGNPPYAKHSSNRSAWIDGLLRGRDSLTDKAVSNYYSVDGVALGERNPKWLRDDYVKFVRLAHAIIVRTGCGVLGMITNHGYLRNPTFRGMRQSLITDFDRCHVLDVHGNSKIGERTPTGAVDENVFDIQQGVAIAHLVRTFQMEGASTDAKRCIRFGDLWGTRMEKQGRLALMRLGEATLCEIVPTSPAYLLVPVEGEREHEYKRGLIITSVLPNHAVGFQTHRDYFVIDMSRDALLARVADFADPKQSDEVMRHRSFAAMPSGKYPRGDTRDWKLAVARARLGQVSDLSSWITRCIRRPFDFQWYFHHAAAVDYGRPQIMNHLINHQNIALLWTRPMSPSYEFSVLVADVPVDQSAVGNKAAGAGGTYVAPLYEYSDVKQEPELGEGGSERLGSRRANMSDECVRAISEVTGLSYCTDGSGDLSSTFGPEDVLHFAYAVFHAASFRVRYREFLKRDVPRLPLPRERLLFAELVALGQVLTTVHLLSSPLLDRPFTSVVGGPHLEVVHVGWANDTVWLDKRQTIGFRGVREEVWQFQIGGYQVCSKWLKDRKGRTLSRDDIAHYQRIVVALSETIRLMKEIDGVIEEHGGWPGAFAVSGAASPVVAEASPNHFEYDTTPPPLRKVAEGEGDRADQ